MSTNTAERRTGTFRVQGTWDGAELFVTVEDQRPRRLSVVHPTGRVAQLLDLQALLYGWGVEEHGHWNDVSSERTDGRTEEVVCLRHDGGGSGPAVQGCCKPGCETATDTLTQMGGTYAYLCEAHDVEARNQPHLFAGAAATLTHYCAEY